MIPNTPAANPFSVWFWLGVYALNKWIIRSNAFRDMVLIQLRMDVLYLDGGCQRTGRCCQAVMLYNRQRPITTVSGYQNAVRKDAALRRFIPVTNGNQIDHYNCEQLAKDNTCLDYAKRPKLCHLYPHGNLASGRTLHAGCGYRIIPKIGAPKLGLEVLNADSRSQH